MMSVHCKVVFVKSLLVCSVRAYMDMYGVVHGRAPTALRLRRCVHGRAPTALCAYGVERLRREPNA